MATAAPAAPTANKAELLAIADAVAREKLIDKGLVIEAMEDAIQRAARARYGAENDIRAKLDPNTGDLRLWRVLEVVEEPEDHFKQVDLKGAQKLKKDAQLGDFIVDPLPPIEFGRIAAQAAKQVSGDIVGIDGDTVTIATPKGERSFPFANIASAKLLLTDKLINATAPLSTEGADTIKTEG
jgi:hypothetical protein